MDIKTITATLALLGTGMPLAACDSGEKPAKEADKAEKKADAKDEDKANAKAEDKGEMACGEGKCGAGGCGAKKGDKALADGEKKDAAAEAPKADEDADKS
ncbi:MAG: hypothetical protein ACE37F_22095 [Nannocystaceae bacterium]|nr:hypothetical protein [bacterium]